MSERLTLPEDGSVVNDSHYIEIEGTSVEDAQDKVEAFLVSVGLPADQASFVARKSSSCIVNGDTIETNWSAPNKSKLENYIFEIDRKIIVSDYSKLIGISLPVNVKGIVRRSDVKSILPDREVTTLQ